MSVILKDSGNVIVYTFPSGIELTDEPHSIRQSVAERVHAHGGVITGDQKVASRTLTVSGTFHEATESALKAMRKVCHTHGLRLYATQNSDEFYQVECLRFAASYQKQQLSVVRIAITFICVEGFRYYKDETTDDETGIISSPHEYTVANGGDVEVSPVITFTVGAGASITKIMVENATDSSKYFEYTPASPLTSANVVKIDCKDATCSLDETDDIVHFSGLFFELKSGDNSIIVTITGTIGTNQLEFKFRKRFL